ncbi:hypothetical protein [Micromonospora sp. MH33]|uniref:hypothetical protein n=1 Tax=Micromonospora sp. MH33 TaxID=1945509 RepID=UPI001FEDCD87|nr:hypothetical protein [Micromonospora sp. MH33]
MEDQQAPQSAEGEAKVITLCGSIKFEAEFAEVNQRLTACAFPVSSTTPGPPTTPWRPATPTCSATLSPANHFSGASSLSSPN